LADDSEEVDAAKSHLHSSILIDANLDRHVCSVIVASYRGLAMSVRLSTARSRRVPMRSDIPYAVLDVTMMSEAN